jgi:hypothetical protein
MLQTYPFDRLNPSLPSPEDTLQKGDNGLPIKSSAFIEAIQSFQSKPKQKLDVLQLNGYDPIGTLKEACHKRVSDVPRLKGCVSLNTTL